MTHEYKHTFINGVRATATVADDPPAFKVQWHGGVLCRELLGEYCRWRESILVDFTERTGKKILVLNLI